jgi:cytochrome c556
MPMKRLALTTLAAALALSAVAFAQDTPAIVADPAIATMTNEQLVEARQAAMKEDGMLLRGAADLSGDEAVAAATTLLQNFTNFPALFREGSAVGASHALPVIWEQWDEFEGKFKNAQTIAATMLTAAQAADTAAYVDAVKALGGVCGDCHMTYRGH